MQPLEFAKGHGTGNDFVIIPDPDADLILTPELVEALCDRRFGVGGDGVLRVVRTAADPQLTPYAEKFGTAEWFMDYRNADGSVAEMCGNGVRVFARYLVDHQLVAGESELLLGTRAGLVTAVVTDEAVSVTMGLPRVIGPSRAWIGGRELAGTAVDCGNPHLVCPLPPELELTELDLSDPPRVDEQLFPDGVNVELTAPPPGEPASSGHIRLRVYERGVGETLACGSGACAAAAVALREGGHTSGLVRIDVPGGRLAVSLTDEDCALTGPAVLVAWGTVALSALPYR